MRHKTHSKPPLQLPPETTRAIGNSKPQLTPLQERILEWDREYLRQTKRLASIMTRAKRRLSRHDHLF